MLLRQGIQFSATSTAAERYNEVLDFIKVRAGGAAEAINPLELATKKLHVTIEENNEALGKRFAPLMAEAVNFLNLLLTPTKENAAAMTDLKAALLAAGVAISAIGVGLPLVVQGFLAFKAAVLALNAELTVTKALMATLGIGLLVAAITVLALHWKEALGTAVAVTKNFASFVSQTFSGLKEVITGALHLDGETIKKGLEEIGAAFKNMGDAAVEGWNEAGKASETGVEKQVAEKKKLADKLSAEEKQQRSDQMATIKAENELITLELDNAGKKQLELKKKEINDRKQLEKTSGAEQEKLLREHLRRLEEEQKKYGTTYKAINQVIRSNEIQGTKEATGELVQLTQSKNETLKQIGKVAAVANITIKTAEAAMNIYEGFSAIPFIGQALGIAGAAAAIAFGAEQVGTVMAAAQGGMVTGGTPGVDSVPALLMPGELVVPKQNYEEVVTSVAKNRDSEQGATSGGNVTVEIALRGDAIKFIEAKILERQRLKTSILPRLS